MKTLVHLLKNVRLAQAAMLAVMLAVMWPATAMAEQPVSGTIKPSEITDERLVLTGPTTFVVNQSCYVRQITGDYDLTIVTNTGCTLTVDNNKDSWAVAVPSRANG